MAARRGVRLAALAVAAAVLLTACSGYQQPGAALQWGVFVPDDGTPGGDVDSAVADGGRDVDDVLRFAAVDAAVPADELIAIGNRGATPILTLEPWDPSGGLEQPDWDLHSIIAGAHDADLRRWAAGLARLHRPVLLRFAHEMNGDWYPWSAGLAGNTPAEYVAAWRHVHRIFDDAHADQVRWVWAPNVPQTHVADVTAYFPGTDVVDVLGIDGYNADDQLDGWRTPQQLFQRGLDQLRALPGDLPIMITETASAEGGRAGEDKAAWITALFAYLRRQPGVTAVVWFEFDKEHDWRFTSSVGAQTAMRAALAALHR
jgi:hypothetical protein